LIHGLDHLAIAVEDLDVAVEQWRTVAGAVVLHREVVVEQKVRVVMLRVGTLQIELLAPTSPDSPVAKFLAKRGPGLHHVALRVDSTQTELDRLSAADVRLIDRSARRGAEETQVGFVHPQAVGGVLVEFVEHGVGSER
jgi:methylmalonyl-CoA/ethylmalonyl-CoA epimerase